MRTLNRSSAFALPLLLAACASAPPAPQFLIIPETAATSAHREAIERVLKAHQAGYLDCFKALQHRDPVKSAHFTAEFSIQTNGKVGWSRAHETTTKDQPFQACLLTIINQLKFAAPKEQLTVRYPFAFDQH